MPGEDRIDSVANSGKIIPELDRIYEAMSKVASLIITINDLGKNMGFGKGFKEAFEAMKQAQSGIRELNKAKEEAVRAESELKQALLESKKANQDLKNQIAELTLAEKRRREEAAKAKAAITAEAGSVNDLRNQLKKLQAQWDSYGPAARNANRGVLDSIRAIDKELKSLEGQTGRFQRNVGNYPQIVGGLTGLLGSFGITIGAGAIAKEVFDTTLKLDSLDAALKVVSGTTEAYNRNQQFLLETSERLGLNIVDLAQGFKLFYASATGAGISADETRRIFNAVAEAGANLRLSQEDVNGILLAFNQVASKGKVQAEELRGQIGERLPRAFELAAKAIGVSQQELDGMLKKGQVIATDFLPKFATEIEKAFGIENTEQIDGLQGSINRLSNEFTKLVNDNQSGLSKFFTVIVDGARDSVAGINDLLTEVKNLYTQITNPAARRRELFFEAVAQAKAPNDAVVKDFESKTKDEQERIFQGYKALAVASQKNYRDAVSEFGKQSAEARRALLQYVQDTDLLNRVNQIRNAPAVTKSGTASPPTEKELNAAARLREAQLKAELEARKIDLEDAIASQKEIIDNEKVAYEDRLVAAETYFTLKNLLAKESADGEKKIIDVEISRGRATAAEKITVDKKAAAEQAKNRRELGKIVIGILKDNTDQQTKEIIAAGEKRQAELEKQGQDELAAVQKLYDNGKINKDQYELEKLRIENKYQILSLQAEYEYTEEVLRLMRLRGEDTSKQEQQLLDIRNKIRDLDLKYHDQSEKEKTKTTKEELKQREKAEKEFADRVKDLRQELGEAVSAVISGIFERQKNRLQDEIDLISQRQEAEVAAVNASSASEEEKAQKIQVINAQADAQKQALERRQKQFDQQKARFERAKSVVEIIANTGIGIAKAFADYPYFLAAPLAAVIGAIGAAQLATVLAQPIPKYKEGTEDHPGGPAHVGDGGVHEVIQAPDGRAWITPATDTVMNIPARYKVHPSVDDYLAAAGAATMRPLPAIDGTSASVDRMTKAVLDGFDKQTDKILDGLERSKTSVHINNSPLGVRATVSKAAQKMRWLNHEFDL